MSRRKPTKLNRRQKQAVPNTERFVGSYKVGNVFEIDVISENGKRIESYYWDVENECWVYQDSRKLEDAPFEAPMNGFSTGSMH